MPARQSAASSQSPAAGQQQRKEQQRQQHLETVLGGVQKQHVPVIQHAKPPGRQHKQHGQRRGAPPRAEPPAQKPDNPGPCKDQHPIGQVQSQDRVAGQAIEGQRKQQRAVQFHGGGVDPILQNQPPLFPDAAQIRADFGRIAIQRCAAGRKGHGQQKGALHQHQRHRQHIAKRRLFHPRSPSVHLGYYNTPHGGPQATAGRRARRGSAKLRFQTAGRSHPP